MAHHLFDENEGDENENADDHDAVGVRGWPPDHRALIPGKVEEDQGGDAENRSKDIDTLPDSGISRLWAPRRWGCGNGKNGEDGQQKASKAQDPEGPGPPESLRKQAGKDGADKESSWGTGTKQTEDHILAKAWIVGATEDGDGIRKQEGRADALHGAAEDEEGWAAVDGNTSDGRPHSEPSVAANEEELVAEHIAQAAGDEDESANGERVPGGEPTELCGLIVDAEGLTDDVLGYDADGKTGLSEELRGDDDGDEEDLAGDGLGPLDTGIERLQLMVLCGGIRRLDRDVVV